VITKTPHLLVSLTVVLPFAVESEELQPPLTPIERAAISHLRNEAGMVRCDEDTFLFGVAYIDGSYMERIFLAEDEQGGPGLDLEFHQRDNWPADGEADGGGDLAAMPFSVELRVPSSRYALPSGSGWRVPPQQPETALRFKYTNWYGEISRQGGDWMVDWQGYRRPMLPDDVREHPADVCALFGEG
jgi:hypothetical protein